MLIAEYTPELYNKGYERDVNYNLYLDIFKNVLDVRCYPLTIEFESGATTTITETSEIIELLCDKNSYSKVFLKRTTALYFYSDTEGEVYILKYKPMKDGFKARIALKPIPASRPRVSRFSTYYNEPYNTYKKTLEALFVNYKKYGVHEFTNLSVKATFYLAFPTRWSNELIGTCGKEAIRYRKANATRVDNNVDKLTVIRVIDKEFLEGKYAVTTPDIDNLAKALYDALNKVLFKDDQLISLSVSVKRYSKNPRTVFEIKKINGEENE